MDSKPEEKPDTYGVKNVSGFYGAGITFAFFMILLAFYVDLFAWLFRRGKLPKKDPLKSWIARQFARIPGSGGEAYTPVPQPPSEESELDNRDLNFGFNRNFCILLVYYIIAHIDLIVRFGAIEDQSHFASLLTATGFYLVASLCVVGAAFWILFAYFVAAWSRESDFPNIVKFATHRGFLITLGVYICLIASKASMAGVPGDKKVEGIAYLKDNRIYANLIWPHGRGIANDLVGHEETISGTIAAVCVERGHKFAAILSIMLMVFNYAYFAGVCYFFLCIILGVIYNSFIMKGSWFGTGYLKIFGQVVFNGVFIVFVGYCGKIFMSRVLASAEVTAGIISEGFRFLPNAPGSFREVGQVLMAIVSFVPFVYSCYLAAQS